MIECSEVERLQNVIAANKRFLTKNHDDRESYIAGMQRTGKKPNKNALAEFNRHRKRYLANIAFLENRVLELSRDAA